VHVVGRGLALVTLALALAVAPATARSATILVLGDSLSAEYGLPRDSGWVKLLADRIAHKAPQYSVVNASISGDTTSGGRARLADLLLRLHPAVVIIELGANDGLRGLRVEAMRTNLQAMIDACRHQGARVLLIGSRVPPNYGTVYGERFYSVYGELAQRNHIALVPFLLEGFADRLDWFQADHMHPLPQAQAAMLANVWPHLQPLLGPPGAGVD
jgi:acyl-CoA thioesterase-1